MENTNGSVVSVFGGRNRIALFAVLVFLSVFLFAKSMKELKSIAYVDAGMAAVNTINVSGTGEIFHPPDIATFTFSVRDENLVVGKAQDSVNKNIKDIVDYLKKSGVAEKDIRTLGYHVYPRYEYPEIRCLAYPCPPSNPTLSGYEVSQTIEVNVRKLEDAGKLVAGAGELGATEISGLAFTVDDDEALLREARQEAIDDAQEKAKELARDLGVRLVRIVSFSEGGNYPIYYAKDMAMGMGGAVESAPRAVELPIGENQFISNVTITYEIR